jgi:hypothetical protein
VRYSKPLPPPFPPSSMPPVSARFPPPGDQPPLGPRDALPPPVERLPSGPRQSSGRAGSRIAVQVDTDMPSPRDGQPPSSQPTSAAVTHVAPAGPSAPIRAGSGMYADREALATPVSASTDGGGVPKGPRAMNVTTPTGSYGFASGGAPSAGGLEGGYGRGRGRDRSPPPHLGGHGDRMNAHGGIGEGYRGRGVR